MLPDVQFRHLRRDEWQVLRNVRLDALRESPQSFLVEYGDEEEYGRERWQAEFDRGDWIVGEHEGEHVCLTGVTRQSGAPEDERYLEYVWVAPDFRRRRAALRMLRYIIGELEEDGVRTVLLWTLVGKDAAQLLYKELDFITTNERQKLLTDPRKRRWERLRRDLYPQANESYGLTVRANSGLVAASE